MKTHHRKILSKVLTAVVFFVSIFNFALPPVMAGIPSTIYYTLSSAKVSVNATHGLFMILPAGGITTGDTLTVTYTGFGTDFAGTPTVNCGTAGSATAGFATNVLTLTGGATACTGLLEVQTFTGTNPGTAGSKIITLGGTAGITGSFAIAIVTDDQVSVTASVDPSITFNVGSQAAATACDGTFSGNGGTVALGTLTTSAVTSSDVSSVAHICTRVTTNAWSGAYVTVQSANAALKSTSTPTATIPSSSATPLVAGVTGYGICAGSAGGDTGKDVTVPVGGSPSRQVPFAGNCDSTNHNIGGVTTGQQVVWQLNTGSQNAFARIWVKAAISGTVAPFNDYTDTLTFVATATF